MNYLEFGFNYDVTDNDYVDFSLNAQPFKCTNESTISGNYNEFFYINNHKVTESSYFLDSKGYLFYRYLGTTFTYDHAFVKDRSHLFSSYIDFSTYLHPLDDRLIDNKQFPFSSTSLGYESKEFNEICLTLKLSYKNKLFNGAFEIGIESEFDHIPKVTSVSGSFDNNGNITKFANEPSNQEVNYQQDIHSAYLLYKNEIDKFEYQFGIRGELTDRKSDYSFYNEYNIKNTLPATKTLKNLFPTIHTLYNFSENHQIGINYSRRISRPEYFDLIPIIQYKSTYSYITGNAMILPSYSNSFGLFYKKNWKKNCISAEIFTRNTQNVREEYARTDTLNVLVITPENVGDSRSTGVEIMTNIDLFSWCNINLSTSIYDYRLNISIDDINNKERQIRNQNILQLTFSLKYDIGLKFDFYYNSPSIAAQLKFDDYFYSNIGIDKGFNNDRWHLVLAFSDILNSLKYKSTQKASDFSIVNEYIYQPSASFRLSYNLNNQE